MRSLCIAVVLALAVVSCGPADQPASTVGPRRVATLGGELFSERVVGGNPGCITCHSLESGVTLVGPSLASVASPVPGLTVDEYVRQSILEPDAYLTPGFVAGQMPGGWGDLLTIEQIDSLVEFLAVGEPGGE